MIFYNLSDAYKSPFPPNHSSFILNHRKQQWLSLESLPMGKA